MLNEETAIIRCIMEIANIFGFEYVKEHRNSPFCRSVNNDVLTFSYLFESTERRPDLRPNRLGWTVYATVSINLKTEEITVLEYRKPNGEIYINHVHELEKIYMPYAIFNEAGEIIAFSENMPQSARLAAKEHIEISAKFDDISNFDYWEKLLIKLKLK